MHVHRIPGQHPWTPGKAGSLLPANSALGHALMSPLVEMQTLLYCITLLQASHLVCSLGAFKESSPTLKDTHAAGRAELGESFTSGC